MWFLTSATSFLGILCSVLGHGRLMDPPARNSMWRLGFPNPVNYNDNELYCGGRVTQWARNKGKCGVCGDPHHHTQRDHEVGGKYANGIISREYVQGGVIDVTVHITANHKGFFEFRICPVEDPAVEVNQECLDKHVMKVANEEGSRYYLPEGKSNQFFNVTLELPEDVTCKQCVIQWKYRTGNTWDKDESGKFCVGCGPQEEFYNCADVTIHPKNGHGTSHITGQKKVLNNEEQQFNNKAVKKEDIVFTNVKDDGNNLNQETISEYGKQKVDFMNKLETEKYSLWREPEVKSNQVSPFAHLARKDGDVSDSRMSSGLRFGFNGDRYTDEHTDLNAVTASKQPVGVAYRWKAGTAGNSDFENIRRRFSYSSHTSSNGKSYDRSWKKREERQGNNESAVSNDGRARKGTLIEKSKPLNIYPDQGSLQRHHPYTSRPTTSHSLFVRRTMTSTPASHSKSEIKATTKPYNSLKNMMRDKNINPQQEDNFLKRWKLMRLKHIAALATIRSVDDHTEQTTRHQITSPSEKSKTKFIKGTRSMRNRSSARLTHLSQPFDVTNDIIKKTDHTSYSPSTTPIFTEFQGTKPQMSQQKYQKKHLPSWLVKALKLTHWEGDKKVPFSKTNDHRDFITEVDRSSVAASDDDDVFRHKNVQLPLDSRVRDFSKLSPLKRDTTIYHNTQSLKPDTNNNYNTQRLKTLTARKLIATKTRQHNDNNLSENTKPLSKETLTNSPKTTKDVDKSGDTLSNNKEDDVLKDTESLVRYIVTLLLSRKENGGRSKHQDKTKLGRDILESISASDSILPVMNDNGDYNRFLPGSKKISNIKNTIINNRGNREYVNKRQETQLSTLIKNLSNFPEHSKHQKNMRSSSVRPEVLPYSGNILGSDYSYSRKQTGNNVNSFLELMTARPVTKMDKANVQTSSFNKNNYINHNEPVTPHISNQYHKEYLQNQNHPVTTHTSNQYQKEYLQKQNKPSTTHTSNQYQKEYLQKQNKPVTTHTSNQYQKEYLQKQNKPSTTHTSNQYQKEYLQKQNKPVTTHTSNQYQKEYLQKQNKPVTTHTSNQYQQEYLQNQNEPSTIHTSKQYHKELLKEQQSQPKWLPGQGRSFPESSNDRHHLWSNRAGSRQAHYTRQQEPARPQLVCESLTARSGDMDRWCSDNCNANFCPPSICVCFAKEVRSSSYSGVQRSSNTHPGMYPRQQNGHFISNVATEGIHNHPGLTPESRDLTKTDRNQRTDNSLFPENSAMKNDEPFFEPNNSPPVHNPDPKVRYSLRFSHRTNKENRNLSPNSRGYINQDANTRVQSLRVTNTNLDESTHTKPLYAWYSKNMIDDRSSILPVVGQNGMGSHFRRYHRNDKHFQSHPGVKNNAIENKTNTFQYTSPL